jgi:hypothetical protein
VTLNSKYDKDPLFHELEEPLLGNSTIGEKNSVEWTKKREALGKFFPRER